MGKATIISGGADGRYTIKLDHGKAVRDARVTKLQARQTELAVQITQAQAKVSEQQASEAAAQFNADAAIEAYVAASQVVGPALDAVTTAYAVLMSVQASVTSSTAEREAAQAAVTAAEAAYQAAQAALKQAINDWSKATTELLTEKGKMAPLRLALQLLQDEQAALQKELSHWQSMVLEDTLQAWCADLTEDATGTVATIEIPGENLDVMIAPEAPAPTPADGVLTAREVQSPEQVFFNAAILPGWQKYRPTYRRGEVLQISDAGTMTVKLDDDKSSAQNLGINQAETLNSVPVKYMSCDAAAFEVGDRCIVRFTDQDWTKPTVVGFAGNPKPCGALVGAPASDLHRLGYTPPGNAGPAAAWAGYQRSAWPETLKPRGSMLDHPGNITWSNPDIRIGSSPVVLSWLGPSHRYARSSDWDSRPAFGGIVDWRLGHYEYYGIAPAHSGDNGEKYFRDGPRVWVNGNPIVTPCRKVIAAALFRPDPVGDPDRVVLRLCTDEFPLEGMTRRLAFLDVEKAGSSPRLTLADLRASPALAITASYPGPAISGDAAAYVHAAQRPHFNQSGTAIASLFTDRFITKFAAGTLAVGETAVDVFYLPAGEWSNASTLNEVGTYFVPEGSPPPYLLYEYTTNGSSVTDYTYCFVHAVDFVGDTPAALYARESGGESISWSETQRYDNEAWPTGSSFSQVRQPRTTQMVHTHYGPLFEKTYTDTADGVKTSNPTSHAVFLGDLSRNTFAIGLLKADTVSSSSVSGPTPDPWTRTAYNQQYEFQFWVGQGGAPVNIAGPVDGGYWGNWSIAPVTTTYPGTQPPRKTPAVNDLSMTPTASYSSSTSTVEDVYQTEFLSAPPYYRHAAVDPSGKCSYFGIGHFHQGMDVLLRVGSAGAQVLEMPAYAPGDMPTLLAPVFLR